MVVQLWRIAGIYVVDPFSGHLNESLDCRERGRGFIHFIVWIIPANMQNSIFTTMVRYPVKHLLPLFLIIIVVGNNQEGQFQVPPRSGYAVDGFKNRMQTRSGTFLVEQVSEGLVGQRHPLPDSEGSAGPLVRTIGALRLRPDVRR